MSTRPIGYGFFWTLDSVTTLGELPAPSDTVGRLILVGLEVLGIGTLFYGLADGCGILRLRSAQRRP